jgi:hypothetical protein
MLFVPKEKTPKYIGNCMDKNSLNAPKLSHKNGFKTHLKQKKTRKDMQPTKLDFQNSDHLHDI